MNRKPFALFRFHPTQHHLPTVIETPSKKLHLEKLLLVLFQVQLLAVKYTQNNDDIVMINIVIIIKKNIIITCDTLSLKP